MARKPKGVWIGSAGLLVCATAVGAEEARGPASLTLPVRVPVQLLQPAVREAFPVETDREEIWVEGKPLPNGAAIRYQIYFFRGPATIGVAGGDLEIRFDEVQYRLRAEVTPKSGRTVSGGCGYGGEWPRRARLEARTEVRWSEGWTLATRTAFAPPTLLDPCRLPDGTDLGPALEAGLADRLEATAAAIDAAIAEHGASRHRFETFWRAIAEPVELAPGTWLQLRPRDAVAGAIGGEGDRLEAQVGLTLDPEVTLGPPVAGGSAPAPPLRLGAVPPQRLHMSLPVVATWDEVSERLREELVGTELSVLGRTGLRIDSARAFRQGSAIAVEMGVSGLFDGRAFVLGRADLEPDGRALRLRDVVTTVETASRLAGAMSGLAEKALSEAVEAQGRIDLGDRLERLRRGLLGAVNREIAPGIWLQGEVVNVRGSELRTLESGVETTLRFDADVRVELR